MQKPLSENFLARVQANERPEEVNLIEQWRKEISLFLSCGEDAVRQHKIELEIACAQLCGLGHYRMKGYVTIHDDEGYQAWLDEQAEYLEEDGGDDDDWGDDDW